MSTEEENKQINVVDPNGTPGVKIRESDVSIRPSDGGLTGSENAKLKALQHKAQEEYDRLHPLPDGRIPFPIPPDQGDHEFNIDFNRDFGV